MVARTTKRSATVGKAVSASDSGGARVDRVSPEQRAALGKAARAKVPLEAHAEFRPARSAIRWPCCSARPKPAYPSWCRFDMAGCWYRRSRSTEERHW